MKNKVTILSLIAVFSISGLAFAGRLLPDKPAPPPAEQPKAAVPAVPPAEKAKPVMVGNRICPVCEMAIPANVLGKITAEHNGKLYNVCSAEDKAKFLAAADKYSKIAQDEVDKTAAARAAAAKAATGKSTSPAFKKK